MGAEYSNGNTEKDQTHKKQHEAGIIVDGFHFRNKFLDDHQEEDHRYCRNHSAQGTIDHRPYIHRFGNKPAGGPNHLHGLDQETVAEHGQFDGIIDQYNHHNCQHDGHDQDTQADIT